MKPYYHDEASGICIYHGKAEDVLPRLRNDGSGQVVVATDPPYLNDGQRVPLVLPGVAPRIETSESVGVPWGYSLDWVEACASLSPAHWLIYCNYRMLGGVQLAVERYAKLGCTFVWRKSNAPRMARPVPRLDCEFALWFRHPKASCGRMGLFKSMVIDVPMLQAGCFADERILEDGSGKAAHPCQKPLDVVRPFIGRMTEPGDLVVDPFMGTGTTLVAAKECGCRAVGVDENEDYCAIAARRLAQGVLFTGGAA